MTNIIKGKRRRNLKKLTNRRAQALRNNSFLSEQEKRKLSNNRNYSKQSNKETSEDIQESSDVEDNFTTLPYVQNNCKLKDEDVNLPYRDYISFDTTYHSKHSTDSYSSSDSSSGDSGSSNSSSSYE